MTNYDRLHLKQTTDALHITYSYKDGRAGKATHEVWDSGVSWAAWHSARKTRGNQPGSGKSVRVISLSARALRQMVLGG